MRLGTLAKVFCSRPRIFFPSQNFSARPVSSVQGDNARDAGKDRFCGAIFNVKMVSTSPDAGGTLSPLPVLRKSIRQRYGSPLAPYCVMPSTLSGAQIAAWRAMRPEFDQVQGSLRRKPPSVLGFYGLKGSGRTTIALLGILDGMPFTPRGAGRRVLFVTSQPAVARQSHVLAATLRKSLRDLWLDVRIILDPFHRLAEPLQKDKNVIIFTTEQVFRTALECSSSWMSEVYASRTDTLVLHHFSSKPLPMSMPLVVTTTLLIASSRKEIEGSLPSFNANAVMPLFIDFSPTSVSQERSVTPVLIPSTSIFKHQVSRDTLNSVVEQLCYRETWKRVVALRSVSFLAAEDNSEPRVLVLCDSRSLEAQNLFQNSSLRDIARELNASSSGSSLPYTEDTLSAFRKKTSSRVLVTTLGSLADVASSLVVARVLLQPAPDTVILLRPSDCPHAFLNQYATLQWSKTLDRSFAPKECPVLIVLYYPEDTRRLCAFEAAYSQLCSTTTTTVTPSAFQTFCLTDDTAVHTSPRSSEKLLLKQKPATKVVDQNRNENAVLLLHDPFKKHLGTLQNVKKVVKAALGASSVQCLHHVVAVEAPRGFYLRLPLTLAQTFVRYAADRTNLYVTYARCLPQSLPQQAKISGEFKSENDANDIPATSAISLPSDQHSRKGNATTLATTSLAQGRRSSSSTFPWRGPR